MNHTEEILKINRDCRSEILKISKLTLTEKITVRKLNLSQALIKGGYKLIKKIDFNGTLIDLVCFSSLLFVQNKWLYGMSFISRRKINTLIEFDNKQDELRCCLLEFFETCLQFESDAKVMLRLFYISDEYFFETEYWQEFTDRFSEVDVLKLRLLFLKLTPLIQLYFYQGYDLKTVIEIIRNELNKNIV